MNFKALSIATLLFTTVCFPAVSIAEGVVEKMVESPKHKEQRIEGDLTFLFKEALKACALEMDKDQEMSPFAMIKKTDGTLGFFSPAENEKNKKMSVDSQIASVRKMLMDLASTQQIEASVQAMYVTVSNDTGASNQGLVFEIEHRDGVSIMRFIPVSEILDDAGKKTGKLLFEMEKLSTGSKPQTVFAASIVQ